MTRVEAPIDIDAPPPRVWGILIDFPAYGEWNPVITEMIGRPQLGARVVLRVHLPGTRERIVRLAVTHVEPDRELAWAGRLGLPRLFDAEHRLRIERRDDGRSHFVQSAEFRGVLVPLFRRIRSKVAPGLVDLNRALKARAEAALN